MNLLVSLKVKYGFPINMLYKFLKQKDHAIWNTILSEWSYGICLNHDDHSIYLLLKDSENVEETQRSLNALPLVKEEFIAVEVRRYIDFTTNHLLIFE